MKKFIILNMTPFLIWILWFVCILNDIFTSPMIQLGLLLCMPIVFVVINIVFAKDEKLFLCFNGIFAAAHILGYYLSGILYHSFISNDSETELVTNTFTLMSIFYITVITLICFLIKIFFIKSKKS